jgi:hypothetical protein
MHQHPRLHHPQMNIKLWFRNRVCISITALSGVALGISACGSSESSSDDSDDAGGTGGNGHVSAGMSGAGRGAIAGSSAIAGMAGADANSDAGAPSVVAGLDEYSLASTARGSCALDAKGAIQCWGLSPDKWAIPAGQFAELHGSPDEICAVRSDRTVECFDQPGLAAGGGASELISSGKVTQLALQRGAVCGIDGNGSAFCNSSDSIPVPLTVPAGETFSVLSVGAYFACGIRVQTGSILCWGYPGSDSCDWEAPMTGQLDAPTGEFVSLSSGRFSSCAIEKRGDVRCWGAGEPTDDPNLACSDNLQNFGQSIPPDGAFRSLSVGANHTCGVKTDGTVACWGAGTTDECQDIGDNCRQSRPPTGAFEQVTVGNYHSCAITAERKVQCWGYPSEGRLVPPPEFL